MANLTYHPKKQFCSRGHEIAIVGRNKYGQCNECKKINDTKANANPKVKAKKTLWVAEHPEYQTQYKEEHKDDLLEAAHVYYEANKEEILVKNRHYAKEHPEVISALHVKYQTNRGLRVVAWTDLGNIKLVYKNCPKEKTVDHYIPLQGDDVSGLHVDWNLQYLTLGENSSKGNRIDLLQASEWYGKILEEAGLK